LSGYAGTDFVIFAGFDWHRLAEATAEMAEHARRLGIWVVADSAALTSRTVRGKPMARNNLVEMMH
jgi:hypothetical protein